MLFKLTGGVSSVSRHFALGLEHFIVADQLSSKQMAKAATAPNGSPWVPPKYIEGIYCSVLNTMTEENIYATRDFESRESDIFLVS